MNWLVGCLGFIFLLHVLHKVKGKLRFRNPADETRVASFGGGHALDGKDDAELAQGNAIDSGDNSKTLCVSSTRSEDRRVLAGAAVGRQMAARDR